jgi:hypothetical protein
VSLDGSVEGVVVQLNWRSIRIQTDEDDLATSRTVPLPRVR